MNSDLPYDIGEAAQRRNFGVVRAWLAGGSASAPHSVNALGPGIDNYTLLHWTASSAQAPEDVEFARYLLSQGARVDAKTRQGWTALHFACGCDHNRGIATPAVVSLLRLLVAAGATVNMEAKYGHTPLFWINQISESTIDVVTVLLRAGASLDYKHQLGSTHSFEEHLNSITGRYNGDHIYGGAIRDLVASVRAAGSWKAHCRLPHKQILRLRSLVARGRTRERLATTRAMKFIVRQGDNGIVWNILSYWRETG